MTHPKRVSANIENNLAYSLQLNRFFLKSVGAWPQTEASNTINTITTLMLVFICAGSVATILVPCMLYVPFENERFEIKLLAMAPLIHRSMGAVNYYTLLIRGKDLHSCIRHMERDWHIVQKIDEREVMMQYAKVARSIVGICAVFMLGGSVLFTISRVMSTTTFVIGNETFKMHPMTCPAYTKLIDARFSPVNEIMLVVQIFSSYVTSASTVGVCGFAAIFAMHACGQLNVLCAWLNDLVDDYGKEDHQTVQKLAAIVEHHMRVLSFIARLEDIMHKACLAELMGCTINMCFFGYYSIMNWGALDAQRIISNVSLYLSMCFNIFIFCYIGEILTEQCKHVGEMAYMTAWYKLPHRLSLCLILIIVRSSHVIKITAGKLFHLSITTFGDVMKTSCVYLNILRTMTT